MTNSWTATSTTNAPDARQNHTAVWTGTAMIIWGGDNGGSSFRTGGKYFPGTNTWVATTMTNAPQARSFHTAVWTGHEMIVWGGFGGGGYLTQVADIIPARTVGQLPAPPMHPRAEALIPRFGVALK